MLATCWQHADNMLTTCWQHAGNKLATCRGPGVEVFWVHKLKQGFFHWNLILFKTVLILPLLGLTSSAARSHPRLLGLTRSAARSHPHSKSVIRFSLNRNYKSPKSSFSGLRGYFNPQVSVGNLPSTLAKFCRNLMTSISAEWFGDSWNNC